MSSSVSLPPLQNLPQWPRIHTLDKGRYPKPFVKDQFQVLPPPHYSGLHPHIQTDIESVDTSISNNVDLDSSQRIAHLEKSMEFLRKQHKDILVSLHSEIEALKRENKELQFRVIMARGESPKKESSSSSLGSLDSDSTTSPSQAQKLDQVKTMFMEEKIKELNGALQESRSGNAYLQRLLKDAVEKSSSVHDLGQLNSPPGQPQPLMPVSTNPLQVQKPSDPQPRPPTLHECEIIIRHLKDSNEGQAHELLRLKSDLRDVLYSHKWTPDAYLLAKAYVAEDNDQAGDSKLPRIPLKNSTRKIPDAAFNKEAFSLPPLKTTMGKKVSERQKRFDAVKRRQQRKELSL